MGERFDLLATDAKEYAVFLVGLDGDLLCWNTGAERIFGYQSHEIMGQHFSRFFSPEDVVTGQPEHELTTALAEGRAVSNCWQVRKDGSRFWCQAVVTPLLDENKQTRSFARVMHDLTESEAVEAQRKRADGLAEANRSKEEFMALLSHELRHSLLTGVLSFHRRLLSFRGGPKGTINWQSLAPQRVRSFAKESIVTKRVASGELVGRLRNLTTHQLTPGAERSVAGRFAFLALVSKGLRQFRLAAGALCFDTLKRGSERNPHGSFRTLEVSS